MNFPSLTKRLGYLSILLLIVFTCFPVAADSQCAGTYFKTGYRKITGNFYDYHVHDWNGDGKPDFWKFDFVGDNVNPAFALTVFPNNGTGDFAWSNPIVYPTEIKWPGNPVQYDLADYNRDGKTDIFLYSGSRTRIYLNTGSNSFTELNVFTLSDELGYGLVNDIGFYDMNGDSSLDWVRLISIPNVGHVLSYRPGNPDGTFGTRVDLAAGTSLINGYQVAGDFNGDGKTDIAYKYNTANGWLNRVLFSNGNGAFSAGPDWIASISAPPTVADMDGDGKDDLVSIEMTGPTDHRNRVLSSFQSNGDGTFTSLVHLTYQTYQRPSYYNDPNAAEFKIGDFNGDGKLDIIEFGGTFHSVHLNVGDGNFTRRDYFDQLGPAGYLILADFNGDGRTDLYQKNPPTGGMVNAFGEQVVIIKYPQCEPVGETKAVNFDGSLYNDLAMWNPNTGDWTSIEARWLGGDTTPKRFNWGLGTLGDEPVVGDWDGDGISDYAVYRHIDGGWYIHRSSTSFDLIFQFGITGDRPVPADYDGDGLTDAAVFRQSTGDWYVWLTGPQRLMALHWGTNGDRPVPHDYDGDGKTDIAVYRPSEGNWYILRSSDQGYTGLNWGISTDQPVPADYDGDGKSDVAVWRSGVWYILRSSNGAFSPIYWGAEGDIPTPTYYNRESAVPVVYRPSNSVWYNYQEPNTGRFFSTPPSAPVWIGRNFY